MDIQPVTLEGRFARLRPLSLDYMDELWEAGAAPSLWEFTSSKMTSREEMRRYAEGALDEQARGVSLPFLTVDVRSGKVAGFTRFGNISPEHRRVEIGWTFVGVPWQRTPINTEAKYLMMRHAFETWQVNRLELKTSAKNLRSRAAILRIGAKEEGTLRSHMINSDGTVRDTVYFSVIAEEWPEVRRMLEEKLDRPF